MTQYASVALPSEMLQEEVVAMEMVAVMSCEGEYLALDEKVISCDCLKIGNIISSCHICKIYCTR